MAELLGLAAIGCGHFFGHLLAGQLGDRHGGGDLHLVIDRGGADIQRAAEDERETQHIVDLVGIVRTPSGNDTIGAHPLGIRGRDFGIGVGHRKDDRLGGHFLDIFGGQRARRREAEEDICADQRLFQRARIGIDRMGAFPLVEPARTITIDHTGPVTHGDVLVAHAHRFKQRGAGDCRGARTIDDNFDIFKLTPGQEAGVDQPRCGDDRGAVLIIVHHRNFHSFA